MTFFKRLALALLFAAPLAAQTPIAVVNSSFEQGAAVSGGVGTGGPWSYQTPAGWTKTGGNSGLWQPDTSGCGYKSVPGGTTVLWNDGATLLQDLAVPAAASTVYTVTVSVGHRGCQGANTYTISLLAGATVLCSWTGTNSTIPQNTFIAEVNACATPATPAAGDLTISLSSAGTEVDFDNVSVTATPLVPPVLNTITVSISAIYDDGSVPAILSVQVNDVTDPKNTIGQLSLTPDPATGLANGSFTLSSGKTYQIALIMAGKQVAETFYDGSLVQMLMPQISQANFAVVLFKASGAVKSFSSGAS